jgi:DNA invertase Pin-like site-specific DNA recombinase
VYGWAFFDPALLRAEAKRGNLRRLTDDDVRDVRRRAADGVSAELISHAYGVTKQSIYQILNGKSYADVA